MISLVALVLVALAAEPTPFTYHRQFDTLAACESHRVSESFVEEVAELRDQINANDYIVLGIETKCQED